MPQLRKPVAESASADFEAGEIREGEPLVGRRDDAALNDALELN